jgi:hypothetical protein
LLFCDQTLQNSPYCRMKAIRATASYILSFTGKQNYRIYSVEIM